MKPEAQRIAIAEACGWKYDEIAVSHGIPKSMAWRNKETIGPTRVPDYLNDLNAMHEAENTLNGSHLCLYASILFTVTNAGLGAQTIDHERWGLLRATAAQRAEAFLRTLNLWKDE